MCCKLKSLNLKSLPGGLCRLPVSLLVQVEDFWLLVLLAALLLSMLLDILLLLQDCLNRMSLLPLCYAAESALEGPLTCLGFEVGIELAEVRLVLNLFLKVEGH